MEKINLIPQGSDAAAIADMKKQLGRQIILLALFFVFACAAVFAFASRAWFAVNRDVTSNDNSITSDSSSPSLFIRKQGDSQTAYASRVSTDTSVRLFPASTADLSNWYYASGFTYSSRQVAGSGYTYTVNTPSANAYTRIAAFTSADAGTYTNTYEGRTVTAYYLSKINLYTQTGNLDVYLNNVSPITVEYDSESLVAQKQLLNCLRVGISSGGAMKLIYAPVSESGTGNSQGASANTLYMIQSGSLTAAGSTVKTSLTDYLAQLSAGSDTIYTATGSTKICTATPSGTDVNVYVWLEGTDAQALYGLSDSDLKGINVTINYVGVEPAA